MKIKKRKESELRKLPYQTKPLPKEVKDSIKKRAALLNKNPGKPMYDLDKIIKKQESGGYSKTYRNK